MTLKEIYEAEKQKPTSAQNFIAKVSTLTKKTELSVKRWIAGKCEPDELAKQVLAEHFKTTPDELFSHVKR